MCYSFDGTILDRTYAKNFVMPIYIDETTIKGFHFEYVAEIHIQEVGSTMIRTENFLDLMSLVEFFINKHSNLISEEALEKFKRDERKILTNAINKTKELVEIEVSKFDEAQKWLIHAFRYDTIKKRFPDNYANLLYEI
jgi:phage regulator Rha-like protein